MRRRRRGAYIFNINIERDSLLKESLRLTFMIVVHQLQIHVDKQWVEDLRQLCPVAVQHRLDELLQVAVVNLVESWVSLLAIG